MDTVVSTFSRVTELFSNPSVALLRLIVDGFDFALHLSVVEFSKLADITFVQEAWTISRDLANMFFIFILLYIAIATIFQVGGVDTKKMLIRVIIVALLVNFSAFGTKVLIDASNIIALGFYNQIQVDTNDDGYKDIASVIVEESRIPSWLPTPNFLKDAFDGLADAFEVATTEKTLVDLGFEKIGYYVLLIILAFTLFTVAYLFMIRALVLMILIITSPFALLGTIINPLKGITTSWMGQIKSHLIWAPVFMFFLFLSIKMIQEKDDLIAGMGLEDANRTYGESFMANIAIYFFIIGMLLAGMIIAKKMGAMGAKSAIKFGGNTAFGGLALAGRHTVGRAASVIAENKALRDQAANATGTRGFLARTALKSSKATSKASFDLRGSKTVKSAFGAAQLDDVGSAKKGGYKKYFDDRIKAEKEFGDDLGLETEGEKEAYAENLRNRFGWGIYGRIYGKAAEDIGHLKGKKRAESEVEPKIRQLENQLGEMERDVKVLEDNLGNVKKTDRVENKQEYLRLKQLKSRQKNLEAQGTSEEEKEELNRTIELIDEIEETQQARLELKTNQLKTAVEEQRRTLKDNPQYKETEKNLKEQRALYKKLSGEKSDMEKFKDILKEEGFKKEDKKDKDEE